MEFVSVDDLSDSVKKNTDLIDINLDNFNSGFLIDNFSLDDYRLRGTELRKEFNRLCKNKCYFRKRR